MRFRVPIWVYVVLSFIWTGAYDTERSAPKQLSPSYRVAVAFDLCDQYCGHAKLGARGPRITSDVDIITQVFGCTKNRCIINYSPGGNQFVFALAGKAAALNPWRSFVIDGTCASGCTIFADIARTRICTTKLAKLGFHQGYSFQLTETGATTVTRFVPGYSADITAWIATKHGLPTNGLLYMSQKDSHRFWTKCGSTT